MANHPKVANNGDRSRYFFTGDELNKPLASAQTLLLLYTSVKVTQGKDKSGCLRQVTPYIGSFAICILGQGT